jgi:hypothetical protein
MAWTPETTSLLLVALLCVAALAFAIIYVARGNERLTRRRLSRRCAVAPKQAAPNGCRLDDGDDGEELSNEDFPRPGPGFDPGRIERLD